MMPEHLLIAANHLWQSTLFLAIAGALTLVFRRNSAALRYWIWLAASIKFLIPLSLFTALGQQLSWRNISQPSASSVSIVFDQFSRPFSSMSNTSGMPAVADPRSHSSVAPEALALIWLCGFSITAILWFSRWWRIRTVLTSASPLDLGIDIPVAETSAHLEPGVFGVFNPVLLVPVGLKERLTPPQLNAILAHELCHVRRRDNLSTAVHSFIEACFWFYPPVWWIGSRMIAEQERACDEEVLSLGHEPEAYAQGILEICTTYVASVLPGVSGIGGADLKKRIHRIMTHTAPTELNTLTKGFLGAFCFAVFAVPIAAGVSTPVQIRTRNNPDSSLKFEVASIRPTKAGDTLVWGSCTTTDYNGGPPWILGMRVGNGTQIPGQPGLGRCATRGLPLRKLIAMAYDYLLWNQMEQQIVGGPKWMDSDAFDVEAKAENPDATTEAQIRQMLQQLLMERFKLKVHRETRNVSGYALFISKGGPRLTRAGANEPHPGISGRPDETFFTAMPMSALTDYLSVRLGSPVLDRTGLTDNYTFTLRSVLGEHESAGGGPPPPQGTLDSSVPSLMTALGEQLGLRLQSSKVPLPVLVVDSAVKPKEN